MQDNYIFKKNSICQYEKLAGYCLKYWGGVCGIRRGKTGNKKRRNIIGVMQLIFLIYICLSSFYFTGIIDLFDNMHLNKEIYIGHYIFIFLIQTLFNQAEIVFLI